MELPALALRPSMTDDGEDSPRSSDPGRVDSRMYGAGEDESDPYSADGDAGIDRAAAPIPRFRFSSASREAMPCSLTARRRVHGPDRTNNWQAGL